MKCKKCSKKISILNFLDGLCSSCRDEFREKEKIRRDELWAEEKIRRDELREKREIEVAKNQLIERILERLLYDGRTFHTSENEGIKKENFIIQFDEKSINISINNHVMSYSPDRRLTRENASIEKRQVFNRYIFKDLKAVFLDEGPFSIEIENDLFNKEKLIINYNGVGMDSKGNDEFVKIAKIDINLMQWKEFNLKNIISRDRWDFVRDNILFEFYEFPE